MATPLAAKQPIQSQSDAAVLAWLDVYCRNHPTMRPMIEHDRIIIGQAGRKLAAEWWKEGQELPIITRPVAKIRGERVQGLILPVRLALALTYSNIFFSFKLERVGEGLVPVHIVLNPMV